MYAIREGLSVKKKKREGERMSEVEEERESECVYGGRGQIESVRWSRLVSLQGSRTSVG